MNRLFALLLCFVWVFSAWSKDIFVSTTGSDSANGLTLGTAKLTLAGGKAIAVDGDVIRVQPGTYDARGQVTTVNGITWKAEYPAVVGASTNTVVRGFDITSSNNKIIGFEITHIVNSGTRAILLSGTTGTNNLIVDNYIHNTSREAIGAASSSIPAYTVIRGNTIFEPGIIPGVNTNTPSAVAVGFGTFGAHHNLVEYNTFQRCSDFATFYGTNNIARNNSFGDFSNTYFGVIPDSSPSSFHSDMFQMGSAGTGVTQGTSQKHTLIDCQFSYDSIGYHSHFVIIHDVLNEGDTNILFRNSIAYNFGATAGFAVQGADNVNLWNNSHIKSSQVSAGLLVRWFTSNDGAVVIGGTLKNSIFSDDGVGTDAFSFEANTSPDAAFNIGYLCGSEPSFISTNDPLFINVSAKDFRLQAGSAAINAGTAPATITSATGSGTSFDVSDGRMFRDGYGITDGDTITVGSTTTRIISISGNTLTVADSVSWTQNQSVYWGTDTTPDIGALPYESVALTAASIFRNGTVYTVVPVGDVRGVWFYVNGIPTTWDSTTPYQVTVASGTVTAKAYALWAQQVPVIAASLTSGSSSLIRGVTTLKGRATMR